MNSIWRSSSVWLRRARLTKMSPMPLRSRAACSSATSTVTCWIELNGVGQLADLVLGLDVDRGERPTRTATSLVGGFRSRSTRPGSLLGRQRVGRAR